MAEKVGFEPTGPLGPDALQAPAFDHSATSPHATASIISQLFWNATRSFYLAEKVGFEPTEQQAAQLISSQSPSTTRALLRNNGKNYTHLTACCQVCPPGRGSFLPGGLLKLDKYLFYYCQGVVYLLFCDHQGRSEADDGLVGLLAEEALFFKGGGVFSCLPCGFRHFHAD